MMRVMPRLQKLVSSVHSGRNHCGRVVGNAEVIARFRVARYPLKIAPVITPRVGGNRHDYLPRKKASICSRRGVGLAVRTTDLAPRVPHKHLSDLELS